MVHAASAGVPRKAAERAAKLRAQGTATPILLISGALSPAIRARVASIVMRVSRR